MRIGISSAFTMHGGGFTHLSRLLGAWCALGIDRQHEIVLFTKKENVPLLAPFLSSRVQIYGGGLEVPAMPRRLLWEQIALPKLARSAGIDVLFCPNGIVPVRLVIPCVPLFQNVGPFSPAIQFRSSPYDWIWFRTLKVFLRFSARAGARMIFVSHDLENAAARQFGFPRERGDVVYHGREEPSRCQPDPALLERLGVRGPYLLSVGHLYPYKRIPELVQGYAEVQDRMRAHGVQLLLVGRANSERARRRFQELIRSHGLNDWVLLAGSLDHGLVLSLLAGCRGFVFQSTCEAFPIALLEAIAAGVPIACARASVMPEIAADAALYYDPLDPHDIGAALAELAQDEVLRADLGRRALRRAAELPTWADAAAMTLQSIQKVVQASPQNHTKHLEATCNGN